MRYKKRKKPVKEEDLLTDEEIRELAKNKYLTIEHAVLLLFGVRKPWADDEYPPYGPPGKLTFQQVMTQAKELVREGGLKVYYDAEIAEVDP